MKKLLLLLSIAISSLVASAQNPVGKWKKISHVSSYDGQTFDSHEALLKIRPCATDVVWEINADGTFRQNLDNSSCDDKYKNIQAKMYSKTVWKLTGNKLFIGGKEGLGNTYTVTFSGNKMTMTGTEGQGKITYTKIN